MYMRMMIPKNRLSSGIAVYYHRKGAPRNCILEPIMDKAEVAAILEEIAVLLELQGENPFRANAYARAGRTIAQLESNIDDVVAAGTLDQIPGVGETLRDKITLLVTTGKLPFYE